MCLQILTGNPGGDLAVDLSHGIIYELGWKDPPQLGMLVRLRLAAIHQGALEGM
jgi:hypothetical protein